MSADGNTGSNFNRYWYANNNPYKFTDPDGRKVKFADDTTDQNKKDFGSAVKYLNDKGAAGNLTDLEAHSETVYIKVAPEGSNIMEYDPSTKTITWDAKSGLKTTDGETQTPALGLGHEVDHALADVTGTAASTETILGDPYHNAEEKRVIEGYEKSAAGKLGEPIRNDHGGEPVQVQCPTCKE